MGELNDEIEVGGATHEPFEMHFTPTYLTEALDHSDSHSVAINYDHDKPLSLVELVDNKDDYHAWIVPRRKVTTGGT